MTERYYARPLVLSSFFAALTGVCSIISIPLPFSPVPINLALLSVYLAGGLLGSKYGAISQLIYVMLGAVGLPVYHNLTGGIAILAGPTGGYIIGYIAAAFSVGLLIERSGLFEKKKLRRQSVLLTIIIAAGMIFCYIPGTLWFIFISGTGIKTALFLCVIPFLPGDALKIIAATILINKLKPVLN